jgi:sRNA-binding regulator protein Hfq
MRGRAPSKPIPDPKSAERVRAKQLADNGMPYQMALAVAQARMTLDEALERLAQRVEVDRLMRKHDISRALATQVVMGHADLEGFLSKRRLEQHRTQNRDRSCLDEHAASGAPLMFGLHGQRRLEGKVVEVQPYQVVVQPSEPASAEREEVHKLQFKYAYAPDDWKRVRKALRKDKVLSEAPKAPIERPQDRYTCSDRRMFRYVDTGAQVDATLLEGEIVRGQILWFGRYEFALSVKGDATIYVFRHALHNLTEVQ